MRGKNKEMDKNVVLKALKDAGIDIKALGKTAEITEKPVNYNFTAEVQEHEKYGKTLAIKSNDRFLLGIGTLKALAIVDRIEDIKRFASENAENIGKRKTTKKAVTKKVNKGDVASILTALLKNA